MKQARSVFTGGERQVSFDAEKHVNGIVHHLNVLADAHYLQRDEVDEIGDVYRDRRLFKHQRRAIEHELHGLVDLYGATEEVHKLISDGLDDGDATVGVELNVGQFTSGVEVYSGNKHADAEHSFSLGVGSLNPMKRRTLETITDECIIRDEGALLFAFTGYSDSLHVGFKSYPRANEGVIADPSPGIIERLFGDPY